MLQEDRFVRIQSLLASIDRLSTERLIQDMQVSRETVRQDLLALESMGLVRRVHGGVARVTQDEPPFVQRQALRVAEKRAIAKAAVKRLQPGQMVFIDAGTTTAILAEELSLISRLVVVTNSITVALKLAGTQATAGSASSMRVVLLGGDTNPEIPCTYGPVTLNEIRRYRADVTLLSPVAISAQDGVTFGNEHEASLATAMAEQSSSLVVLADYSKIGLRSRYAVACPPSQQTLVTNAHAANTEALEALNAQGVAVIPV
ncbi:DeoR/GlpR family DNA-binding transcription regulator [Comamonas koreensis]|uniref:DeoR/GlpR family DNA-binding transcription regulator n=1 Tax=Comamonas koreensis TaxID=160825 RepID=A0AAW4XX34_9BURK|nr:DeoR/GlpR family DNA-binding transcription regulator [Comamonas koreensis]MCD2165992.1 DeoR/GlpR family DNA-binding transcription regulator [Comamonas koreensis]